MKNKLSDLNNHLFMQLERLGEEQLKGDELTAEIERSRAVTSVAREIISNADLVLKAEKARAEGLVRPQAIAGMLSHDSKES